MTKHLKMYTLRINKHFISYLPLITNTYIMKLFPILKRFVLLSLFVFVLSACSSDDNDSAPTVSQQLVGKWLVLSINGVPADLAGVMQDVEFSSNGDYREVIQNGQSIIIDGIWSLAENDVDITVEIDNGGGTRTWSIDAISSTSLTLIDVDIPYVFEKE